MVTTPGMPPGKADPPPRFHRGSSPGSRSPCLCGTWPPWHFIRLIGPKRPHRRKNPTDHGFWSPHILGLTRLWHPQFCVALVAPNETKRRPGVVTSLLWPGLPRVLWPKPSFCRRRSSFLDAQLRPLGAVSACRITGSIQVTIVLSYLSLDSLLELWFGNS